MVAAHEENPIWVQNFDGHEQENYFELMLAAIDPITIKNVRSRLHVSSFVGRKPEARQEYEHVSKLTMNIS
jgi:hypothetical protein